MKTKKLEELEIGDVVVREDNIRRTVLEKLTQSVLMSQCDPDRQSHSQSWYTFDELRHLGYKFFTPDTEAPSWPQRGDYFYRLNSQGDIIHSAWSGSPKQQKIKAYGNCFRTEEDAEAARERAKQAFLQ